MGSSKLSSIYESWRKENGFEGEYMDDLLAGDKLNKSQHEWLVNMEREYLLSLKREKRKEFLSSPGVVLIGLCLVVMAIIHFSIPKYASDECKSMLADNSFGMIGLGAFIGYFVRAFYPQSS